MDIIRSSTPPPNLQQTILNTQQQQQQQDNSKKFYYKSPSLNYDSSANSTILLKSRSTYLNRNINETPVVMQQQQPQPKVYIKANTISFNNTNVQQLQNSSIDSNNNSFNDELESPLKMKENIQTSLRNLKPTLAGFDLLRSSTSDDDENSGLFDLTNEKKVNNQQQQQKIVTTKPTTSTTTTSTTTTTISQTPTLTKTINNINRHNYVRTPQYRSAYYMPNINTNSNTLPSTTTNTLVTPVYNSNNNLNRQNSTKFNGKRGKEEALSNSSSSDEEELQQHQQQQQSSSLKLQQLLLNPTTPSNSTTPNITPVVHSQYNGQLSTIPLKLSMNSNNLNFNNNMRQPSHNITPIASSTNLHITTVVSSNNNQTTSASNANNLTLDTSKIDNEFDSSCSSSSKNANYSPSTLSTTSSIASYSPIHSVTSPSNNSETIDFQDDTSSTASGPIYIRQPGFDHHAHEVTSSQNSNNKAQNISFSNNNKINTINETKITKISKKTDNKTLEITNKSSKAKKKLCMMSTISSVAPTPVANITATTATTQNQQPNANTTVSTSNQNQIDNNVQLKPIKHKRDALPMRLRALPQSFWQQPNQSNVSPGSMYLPPLFKHESDDDDDYKMTFEQGSKQTREVKISPANTDLLFKLFENIEQKDRKLQHIQLPIQRKLKNNRKGPIKSLSKELIKGEDPCILDAVAEGLFPLLTLDSRNETVQYITFKSDNLSSNGLSNSSPMLSSTSAVVCQSGSNNLNNNLLPLLQLEQNYSQALSEVVAAL